MKESTAMPSTPFTLWLPVKRKYTDSLVLIAHDGGYLSLGKDAAAISEMTETAIEKEIDLEIIRHAHTMMHDDYLAILLRAGHKVAICD